MITTIFSGMTDEELWRFAENTASTPLELELASRLHKLLDKGRSAWRDQATAPMALENLSRMKPHDFRAEEDLGV